MSTLADAIRFRDPVRLARLLRRLGPVATKVGQYLSLRRDLLPRAYTDELLKLTDDVPAFPWSEAKEILTADLGSSPELIFSYIDRAPIAAGSLAQVHRARLPDGAEVAIKIKRPGIDESITVELKRLRRLAAIVERGRSDFAISPGELIDEVAEWLSREVDFTRELENARRLRRAAADSAIQRIPLVYPSLSSPRIVVYEYLSGIPVSSILARGRASGNRSDSLLDTIDRRAVATNLIEACLNQIFRYQFFHADLHPGNLLVLGNNVLGFVDFGFCDALDSSVRTNQLSYLTAVYNDDSAAMFKALTEILIADELADSEGFKRDFMNARREMEGRGTGKDSVDDQPAGEYMSSVLNAARQNGYRVPTSILSIYRALLTAEAVAAQLGLADGIREVGRRFFTEVQSREFYGQLFDRDRIQQLLVSLLNLKRDAPRQLNQILTDIADGTLSLKVEVSEDPRISRSRKQRTKLEACGILSVGVAVLLTMPNPPIVLGVPLQGILAFVLAGLYVAVIYFWRQL